jgi:hypothetical protein
MLAVKGGETCKVSTYSTGDLALAEVKRLGMCYLNVDYNVDVLNAWKASGHYEKIQLALTENAPLSFCERAHDRMHLVLADVDAKLGQAGHLLALASDEIGAAV